MQSLWPTWTHLRWSGKPSKASETNNRNSFGSHIIVTDIL